MFFDVLLRINPLRELRAIIKSEVPVATLRGSLKKNKSVGTIRNPPPAPTKAVKEPMPMGLRIIIARDFFD